MKLKAHEAEGFFARRGDGAAGLLIHGADPVRVTICRRRALDALLGERAEEEMRLTRLRGAELRTDPAALADAVKAVGFFPGPRAVLVEDAADAAAPAVQAALEDWTPEDARIVVTAGRLNAGSKLRKLFEAAPRAGAVALYDDPPGRDEIARILAEAGLAAPSRTCMDILAALAAELGPGDFAQTVEKIVLYKFGDDTPLTPEDIAACAPQSTEAGMDALLHAVAEGRAEAIGPLIRRLQAQGTDPVALCIGATRHFGRLHAAACDPGGVAAGVARLRPPVFGKLRNRLQRQAEGWGAARLEQALAILTDTDLTLRAAGRTAPAMALTERALIRLAMLARAR